MLHRISVGDLEDIRGAAELFNGILECDESPRSYMSIEAAKEFGPWFIDRIIGAIEGLDQRWQHDTYERFIGEKFKPLRPLLEMLRPVVQHEGWPWTDLSLGQLLLIVDYFKKVVERD